MTRPRLLDTTLRDGSHAVFHRFSDGQVRAVASALDAAGVPVVEVAHGDGLGAGSLRLGFSTTPELELIEAAAETCAQARVAVMLLPGTGTRADLDAALACGAQTVRVATLCSEADLSRRYIHHTREAGAEAIGFLMLAHLRPVEELVEQAKLMESYGASGVYFADSAGYMLPADVRARVAALKDALAVPVGFHAHNNLGSAIGNCVAAIEAGADQLDGSLRGLGAGAGNAATELLALALERLGRSGGLDTRRLLDAAEFVVAPLMAFQPLPDRDSALLGALGLYSTFLLYTREAAERYGVDAYDLLVALSRHQPVVGQEDLPMAIARELSAQRTEE